MRRPSPASDQRAELLRAETHLGGAATFSPRAAQAPLRCALLFPNTYQVGMSSLAVHALYALLEERGLACERVFTPPDGPTVSLESGSPLRDFDVLFVSAPFELDWLALPGMLEAGGVPALAAERGEDAPFVLIGGPAVTANPEPLAGIADAAFIGEVEPVMDELVEALTGATGGGRGDLAGAVTGIPGVYVPLAPEHNPLLGGERARVARLYAAEIDDFQTRSVILTRNTEFGSRFLIEVGRGCGRGCGFCLAGCIYRPVRPRRPEGIIAACEEYARPHTLDLGLVGAALSDYPWIGRLAPELVAAGFRISASSLRVESVTEELLAALVASGQDSITLAPEAAGCALREAIGKPVTDEGLWQVCEAALQAGMKRIKLYFMVGLPGETDADALEIAALTQRLAAGFPRLRFITSVGPLVPKPHTALERHAMPSQDVLRRRLAALEAAVSRGAEIRCGSARWAAVQAALSRGGRELSVPLVEASRTGGSFGAFRDALRAHGLSLEQYMAAPEAPDGELPWHVVDPVGTPRGREAQP